MASAVYLLLLAFPQPLFAHDLEREGLFVHSSTAIPVRPIARCSTSSPTR
jgi:hypothetical protein